MNWEAVSAAAAILVPLAGLFATIFWKTNEKIRADMDKQKDRADDLEKRLAEHKLHVAETYATSTELTRAMDGVNKSVGEVLAKLDRLMESKADKECHAR